MNTADKNIHTYKHTNIHTCIHTYNDAYIHTMMHTYMHTNTKYIAMGWLRLLGSFKLQVSFAEYTLFYRALSLKRPIYVSLRSLLIVATP